MQMSMATVSVSGELPEKLSAISQAGFSGVELCESDFLTFGSSAKEVGNMVRDLGLDITIFQPLRDFEGMPEPYRSRNFRYVDNKFDLMKEMGADLILICSNTSPFSTGDRNQIVKDIQELADIAAQRGIRLGYEALAWGKHVYDHRDAWDIVRKVNRENVGIILDSFHTLALKIDPDSIRSIPGNKIFMVQLADAPMIDMDVLHWSRHYRNMPGEGDLPVVDFMSAVASTGYNGPISLEIFNDQFRKRPAEIIANSGYRSLVYLMEQVQNNYPQASPNVLPFPPRVTSSGNPPLN